MIISSFDAISYPQSYFEKTSGRIKSKDLTRLSGSFILPGIPASSDYKTYSLKNSGYNLIGIQNLLDSYSNAIKGSISKVLNNWPAISGWKVTEESLASCKATDVMLKGVYKIIDSLYNSKTSIGAVCNQGAFAKLGTLPGQNPYDYDLSGLFRMLEPLKRTGQALKEIFED